MIELQTSNENALALYSLLSEGQRNSIRVNGTLLSEIRRRGLLVYMNNQCVRSSLYFEDSLLGSCGPNEEMIITDRGSYVLGYIWNIPNPEPKYYVFYRKTLLSLLKSWEEVNEFVNKLNPAVWKYISVCDNPDREGLLSWAGAKEGDVWLEKYDDGTVMFRYKNTPANFWSSNAWNNVTIIDFQKQVAKLRKKINEYCEPRVFHERKIPVDMQKQVIIMSGKGGPKTIGTFEEALNEENAYVKSMANEIRNAKIGSLSIWVDGKHIQWFDNRDEVIRY